MAKAKRNYRGLFVLLGLVIIAAILFFVTRNQRKDVEEVEMETVEKRSITETVSASGKIFPEIEVPISSDVSGEVVELYVEEGDSVKMDELLARIDADAFQSAVERGEAGVNNAKAQLANAKAGVERNKALAVQAEAQIEQIEAQLENARIVHQRNEKLIKEKVISEADFDASLSNLKALEANLRSAKANLSSAKANLESAKQTVRAAEFTVKSSQASLKELQTSLRRTSLYAPMDGIVSKLNVEEGERVVGTIQMTGTELMRIADLSRMETKVEVNENEILRVSLNDEVEIEVDAYLDRKFKGRVKQIANSANETAGVASLTSDQVTNFIVTISIEPDSYKDLITEKKPFPFRPGMSAAVEIITTTEKDVISVPIQAVTTRDLDESEKEEDLREVVFVVKNDTVDMVEVKTGIQDNYYIHIVEGLEGTETIVSGPYSSVARNLEEGKKVEKKEENNKWGKK